MGFSGVYIGSYLLTPLKITAIVLGVLNFISLIFVIIYAADDTTPVTPAERNVDVYVPPAPEPEPEPEVEYAQALADTTVWSTTSTRRPDDSLDANSPGATNEPASARTTSPAGNSEEAVLQFYSAADERNIGLLRSYLRADFEAIFASGCSLLSGASHCGSAILNEDDLIELLDEYPAPADDVELRTLVPGVTAGASGVVATHYRTDSASSNEQHGAAIFKIDDGLVHQIVFYADMNSKATVVSNFYSALDRLQWGEVRQLVDTTDGDDGRYIAVFGAGMAEIGRWSRNSSVSTTMTLAELRAFVDPAGARCTDIHVCSTTMERSIQGSANTVVDHYESEISQGVAIHTFNRYGQIVESYWYSQRADGACSDTAKLAAAREFFEALDDLTYRTGADESDQALADRVLAGYDDAFDDILLTHDASQSVNMFVAVFTSGVHTIGGIVKDVIGTPVILTERCITGTGDSQTTPAPPPGTFGASAREACVRNSEGSIRDFRTLLAYGNRDEINSLLPLCCLTPGCDATNCMTRNLRPEGEVISNHWTKRDANGLVYDAGTVLLTFDASSDRIAQAYWYTDYESRLNTAGKCEVDQRVVNRQCEDCSTVPPRTTEGARYSLYAGDRDCVDSTQGGRR